MATVGRATGTHRLLRARNRHRGVVLLYHDPAPDVLERHLAWLASRFSFVPLDDLVTALCDRTWGSLPPNPLVVTLDDGHRGNYALLEVFRRYACRPTIYLVSSIVGTNRRFWFMVTENPAALKHLREDERDAALAGLGWDREREYEVPDALTKEQIAEMSRYVDFASHTRFHPVLTMTSNASCRDEIVASRAEVERLVGRPCRHFSYPNGDYLDRELEFVREAGYASARTINVDFVDAETDPMQIPILGIRDDAPVAELSAATAGLERWVRWVKNRSIDGTHQTIRPSVP